MKPASVSQFSLLRHHCCRHQDSLCPNTWVLIVSLLWLVLLDARVAASQISRVVLDSEPANWMPHWLPWHLRGKVLLENQLYVFQLGLSPGYKRYTSCTDSPIGLVKFLCKHYTHKTPTTLAQTDETMFGTQLGSNVKVLLGLSEAGRDVSRSLFVFWWQDETYWNNAYIGS